MFPIGHFLFAFLPICAYVVVRDRKRPTLQIVAIAFFGSQFPDLIDKPLYHEARSLITASGRAGAHSLPIAILISLVVIWYAGATDRPRAGFVFVFAYGSHILGDYYQILLDPNTSLPPNLWWPLAEPLPMEVTPGWAGPELINVHLWTVFSVVVLLIAGVVVISDVVLQSSLVSIVRERY